MTQPAIHSVAFTAPVLQTILLILFLSFFTLFSGPFIQMNDSVDRYSRPTSYARLLPTGTSPFLSSPSVCPLVHRRLSLRHFVFFSCFVSLFPSFFLSNSISFFFSFFLSFFLFLSLYFLPQLSLFILPFNPRFLAFFAIKSRNNEMNSTPPLKLNSD